MTTALATIPSTTLSGWTPQQVELVKRTICNGSSDDELLLFQKVCERTGLDPFARQIYAVFRNSKKPDGSWGKVMGIQTGIDGYRTIAERTGTYAGSDEPTYDKEDAKNPGKATVTVYKMVQGQRVPFSASARWSEYVQTDKNGAPTKFWSQMPYLMLGKVAEALALRKAFPNDLSGLYTKEEMDQASNGAVVEGEIETPKNNNNNNNNGKANGNGHSATIASLGKKPPAEPLATERQVDELIALVAIAKLPDGARTVFVKQPRATLLEHTLHAIDSAINWVRGHVAVDAQYVATTVDEIADAEAKDQSAFTPKGQRGPHA